jgi:hypothetical protein
MRQPRHSSQHIAKYRTFTNQLKAWVTDIGYVHVDLLTVTGMDAFYGTWKDGIRARAKKLERLKAFVRFVSSANG